MREIIVTVAAMPLVIGTVLAFRFFDLGPRSASDTLRPLVLSVGPVWAAFLWTARIVLRGDRH